MEPGAFRRGTRAAEPRLLYLGRLKAYKRIELVLDVLEAMPEATLDIVGDGDHREALEAEIARRGLSSRVHMHGYVDEEHEGGAVRPRLGIAHRLLVGGLVADGHGGGAVRHAQRGARGRRPARVDRGRRDRSARPGAGRAVPAGARGRGATPTCASGWARRPSAGRAPSPGSAWRRRTSRCSEARAASAPPGSRRAAAAGRARTPGAPAGAAVSGGGGLRASR